MIFSKSEMLSYFFDDPKQESLERNLNNTRIQYFYTQKDLKIKTQSNEILNACLLSGEGTLLYKKKEYEINQFDFFFMPPANEVLLKVDSRFSGKCKICVFRYNINQKIEYDFENQHYSPEKFIPRGDHSSKEKMATYRTVWTAFKNELFMSGFTNIPSESLRSGVITSVNLEKNKSGNVEIFSHIHPQYPEVYIMCIDDDKYAITQYLINKEGYSVCKDLSDGDGVFFPGSLGHSNFARPIYKKLDYVMYMWIIPTFGITDAVNPVTLKI
ncbi:MAG: hypothetical protein ACFFDX_04300 [Candidatus Odinarchaeota archaeon]